MCLLEPDPGCKAYSGKEGVVNLFLHTSQLLQLTFIIMLFYGSIRVGKQKNGYTKVKKGSLLIEILGYSHLWGYLTLALFSWAGHMKLTFYSLPLTVHCRSS